MNAQRPSLTQHLLALLALFVLLAVGSCGSSSTHHGTLNVILPSEVIGHEQQLTAGITELSSTNFFPKNDTINVYFKHVLDVNMGFANYGPFPGKSDKNGTFVLTVGYQCSAINISGVPINYRAPVVSIQAISTDQNYTATNTYPVSDFCLSDSTVPTDFMVQ